MNIKNISLFYELGFCNKIMNNFTHIVGSALRKYKNLLIKMTTM